MRVETLPQGTGLATDAFTSALLGDAGPADGFLASASRLGRDAKGTGVTPRPLAEALAAEQRRLGTGPTAVANALALGDGALAVVTGQQAGLLGGPMLSLHKAAGAIALAKSLASRLARPVVPVFWVASEDHDWAEANRATVLDASGAPTELSLEVSGDLRSVRDVEIPDTEALALLARLAATLPTTERAAAAVALAMPPAGTDLGSWFGLVLGRLLGDAGLVVVEPHVLAPWAGPVYAGLVRDAEVVADAVRAAGKALRAKGLPAPLDPAKGVAPLFLRDGARGPRRRVELDGASVKLRGAAAPFDRAGLAHLVEREPHLASGDVIGRIFVQNALLPVVACVGGPTELAYWAQARAAHDAVSKAFPAAAPRPSATWIESRVERTLTAFGVSIADVVSGRDRPPDASPSAEPSREVAAAKAAIDALASATADVAPAARAIDAMRQAVADLEAAVHAEGEEREGRGRARWKKAIDAMRPRGGAQERVLSPLSIVARHGVEALREGLARLDPVARGQQVVHLD